LGVSTEDLGGKRSYGHNRRGGVGEGLAWRKSGHESSPVLKEIEEKENIKFNQKEVPAVQRPEKRQKHSDDLKLK